MPIEIKRWHKQKSGVKTIGGKKQHKKIRTSDFKRSAPHPWFLLLDLWIRLTEMIDRVLSHLKGFQHDACFKFTLIKLQDAVCVDESLARFEWKRLLKVRPWDLTHTFSVLRFQGFPGSLLFLFLLILEYWKEHCPCVLPKLRWMEGEWPLLPNLLPIMRVALLYSVVPHLS